MASPSPPPRSFIDSPMPVHGRGRNCPVIRSHPPDQQSLSRPEVSLLRFLLCQQTVHPVHHLSRTRRFVQHHAGTNRHIQIKVGGTRGQQYYRRPIFIPQELLRRPPPFQPRQIQIQKHHCRPFLIRHPARRDRIAHLLKGQVRQI